MSLAIDIDEIVKVNISGTWYDVNHYDNGDSTFFLDSYEFISNPGFNQNLEHGGGQGGICATGFSFIDAETNLTMAGPLTSIIAVMTADPEKIDYRATLFQMQKARSKVD